MSIGTTHCPKHSHRPPPAPNIRSAPAMANATYVDGAGNPYDPYAAMMRVDALEDLTTDEQKAECAEIMGKGLNKITQIESDPASALDGAMMLRLYAAAYRHIPYTDNDYQKVKQERIKRIELFKKRE